MLETFSKKSRFSQIKKTQKIRQMMSRPDAQNKSSKTIIFFLQKYVRWYFW